MKWYRTMRGTIATKTKAKPKKKSEWKGKLQSPKNSHRDGVTLGLFYGTWHSDLCLALWRVKENVEELETQRQTSGWQTNLPDNSPAPSPIAIIPVFAIWWEGPSVRYSFSPVNSSCWKEQFFSQLWGHCLWWCLNPVCFPLWVFLFQPKWKTTSWALPVVFLIPPACGNSCPEIFFLYLPEPV